MRRRVRHGIAWIVGLGCATLALGALSGCSWDAIFSPDPPSLRNADALDRALRLSSLTDGDRPFHLILDIAPPSRSVTGPQTEEMRAQIEIFWLNPITYRTVIRSPEFNQTRIVNGRVVEEHDSGDFYPRWIQNFVDAILEPVPHAGQLKAIPGNVPVGAEAHACITDPSGADDAPDQPPSAQVCFQDAGPRLASAADPTRSVWFDDFVPFGEQQIARTLADRLPSGVFLRAHIAELEPLPQSEYSLLKAMEYTLPEKQIQTERVTESAADALLQETPAEFPRSSPRRHALAGPVLGAGGAADLPLAEPVPVYVRTDRSGRVREAYPVGFGSAAAQGEAVARALRLKFRPLTVDRAPRQMEAVLVVR